MGYDRHAPQLGKSFFFDHLWSTSIGAQILSWTIIRKTTTQNHYAVLGLNLHHSNSNNTVSVRFQLHLYWQSLKAVVLHHWAPKKQLGQLRFLKGGSQLHPSTISTIGSQPVQSISISKKVTTLTFQFGDSFSHSHLWWWSYQRQLLKKSGKIIQRSKLFRN